jgi:hypothetical protein
MTINSQSIAIAAALALACGGTEAPKTATTTTPASTPTIPDTAKRPLDPEALGQFLVPLPSIPVRTPDTTTVAGADYHLVTFEVVEKGTYDAGAYVPAAGGIMGSFGQGMAAGLHKDTDLHDPPLTAGAAGFDPSYTVADNEKGRKDTVKVPPGGYVRIRARFDRPGEYMWHCHILAHEEHARMRPFQVVP